MAASESFRDTFRPLPEGWIKCFSKSNNGKEYYFNTLTGVSLWEHPGNKSQQEGNIISNGSQSVTIKKEPKDDIPKRATLNPFSLQSRKRLSMEAIKLTKKTIVRKVTEMKDIRKVEKKSESSSQQETPVKTGPSMKQWLPEANKICLGSSKVASDTVTSFGKLETSQFGSNVCHNGHRNSGLNKKEGIGTRDAQNKDPLRKINTKKSLPPLKPLRRNKNYKIPKRSNSEEKSRVEENVKLNYLHNVSENRTTWPQSRIARSSVSSDPGTVSDQDYLLNQNNNDSSDVPMTASESSDNDVLLGVDEMPSLVDTPCEDMEIDDAVFMEKQIFQEIEEIRLQRINIPKPATNSIKVEEMEVPHGTLYIVVDTNILLSHLKFVSELRDFPIPGAGRPILVIPWMVVQELDRLKEAPDSRIHEFSEENESNGTGVNVLARRAVAFLNTCFTESHPRVRGQTLMEANSSVPGLIEETNDDSILSCCLFYQSKAESSKTVLLSNDRNLCNKALVNQVKAFPKKNLIAGLRDLFQAGNLIVQRDHFRDYFEEAGVQEALAEIRKRADDLKCELQCILREAFSAVIEWEMEKAYEKLWLEIVKIKPPWTLLDTLTLLEKHWMAVFGHNVKRSLKEQVSELRRKFSRGDAAGKSLLHVNELIDLGFVLCDNFKIRSDYNGIMPKCLAALIVLKKKCKEFIADVSPALISREQATTTGNELSNCVTSALHGDEALPCPSTPAIPVSPDSPVPQSSAAGEVVKHFVVMTCFDEIWKAVTMLSSLIFDALEYPNPYSQNDWKPSQEEARRFLANLIPCLSMLVKAIQEVLAIPIQSSLENVDIFTALGEAIANFMKKIMYQDCHITLDQLRSFCLDAESRTALIQGQSQLDRALAMLEHCMKRKQC
eukprot:gene16031-17651_t